MSFGTRRHDESHPALALDAGMAGFRHGRHSGKRVRARRAGDGQGADLAVPQQWNDDARGDQADRRMPGDDRSDRWSAAGVGNVHDVEVEGEAKLLAGEVRTRTRACRKRRRCRFITLLPGD
jgi:hypothetical protein